MKIILLTSQNRQSIVDKSVRKKKHLKKSIIKGNNAIKLANIISHGINTNIPKENKKKKI